MAASSISDADLRSAIQRMANTSSPNSIRLWFERSNRGGRNFRISQNDLVYPGMVYGVGVDARQVFAQANGPALAQPYPEVPANHTLLIASARIMPMDGRLTANAYRWKAAGRTRPAGWRSIGPITVQPARVAAMGIQTGEPAEAPAPAKRSKAKAGKRRAVKKRRTPERRNVPDSSEAADGMPPVRPDPPFVPDEMDPEGFSGAETAGISGAALVIGGLLAAAFFAGK